MERGSRKSDSQSQARIRHRLRKGVFVIPSLLTTANIFCGFYSVMESILGARALALVDSGLGGDGFAAGGIASAAEHFDRAAINIGFATLFDLLDGRVARMTNATSEFGLELDSIADVVSFGVAPAVLAFSWGYGQVPGMHKLGWIVSFLFVICGALRLARFNVQARRPAPNLPPKNPKDKKVFVGMPIPFAAATIASVVHFAPTPIAHLPGSSLWSMPVSSHAYAVGLVVLVFCLALLMVSNFRYQSFKNVGVTNNPRIVVMTIALLVTAIWFESQWSLLIISWAYALHGVIGKLWSMIKPRREESEAEPEGRTSPESYADWHSR
jgi:CDP-diacylglycerol--serine O-phosphatidyltransferase